MYRLIKFRGAPLCNFQGVSLFNNNNNRPLVTVSEKTCCLCDKLQILNAPSLGFRSSLTVTRLTERLTVIGSKRWQSTHTNPSVVTKKTRKKRARSVKKFAEMLVVTNEKTSECQARVHNLNPNDVKMLALTNFNLSELYKLKDFMKRNDKIITEYTYSNLTDIHNTPLSEYTIKPNNQLEVLPAINDVVREKFQITDPPVIVISPMEIFEKTEVEDEIEGENSLFNVLETVKPNTAFQPEVLEEEIVEPEEPVKEVKKRPKIYDTKAREEMLARTLSAYIEVCAIRNFPQKGLKAYNYHRYRSAKFPEQSPPVKNIKIYNALLKGFAAKGDFAKLREVLENAEEEGVKLNVQSYAAIFECLARVNHQECQMKSIRIFTNEAMRDGITFDRILNEATFLYDQKERVIETMKCYNPNFVPKYFEPSVQFTNHLVNSLNHEDQLKGFPEFKENNGLFTRENLRERIKKQMDLERNVHVTVKSIEAKGEVTEDVLKYRLAWEEHKKLWEDSAMQAFNRDLMTLTAKKSAVNLDAYIRSVPARDFIAIIVDEAQKIAQGSETYSPTVNMLYRDLGDKVYARYKVLKKQKSGIFDKIYNVHSKYCDNYVQSHVELDVLPNGVDNLNARQKWQWAEHSFKHEGATITLDHQEWVPPVLQSIGKFLYNIIMHDIKIDVNALRLNSKHKNYLPAFYTVFRTQARLVKEEVKPHPVLSKLYRASMPETLTFPAYELPMLCPPVPWTSVHTGGYLVAPCEVVRLPTQATMQKERFRDTLLNNLYPSFDSLNQLSSVPWKVNLKILDAILKVFKSGGSEKLDVPQPPSALKPPPPVTSDMDKTQRFNIFRQKLQHRRKRAEMYSLWCDCLYRLSLADHFKDEVFWLPHNMDFRGRVYPIPPHLNHLGSDLARSMLVFAESRPLGPHGLDWLKLHLVNLTGLKKRNTIDERLIFANSIIDDILDSADNPMTGKMWWAESEEPWQTLACCLEIAAAHRSPDPEKYRSHFPVHQDGSCNGLQHYAALGRDSAGAFSVNLTPAVDPQDVYSAVAVLVEQKRKKDAEEGVEIAKTLEGFVRRKVIKQTVMTTVYGVTRFGARLQIARQLKDIDEFPKDSVWAGSSYLTTKTFESLRSMFTSTREIQDWFTECARLISSVCGQNVEWITPLGFPIVQPYFRYKKISNTELFHMDKFEKPNVMKQKNAFPPNFIHSLDSSHMMLTSLYCERAGITFVSVHDCFWTHPSTVHIMNKICREQFVALHSEPILEDLSTFMSEKYRYEDREINDDGSVTELTKRKLNRLLRKLPRTGNFDIKQVLDSVYFFS